MPNSAQIANPRLRLVASRQNALVKELRRNFDSGDMGPGGICAVEGVHILEEAIRSGLKFRAVFFSSSAQAKAQKLLPQIAANVETVVLPDEIFASAVPSETPQGVAALVICRQFSLEDVLNRHSEGPLLAIAGLQDPGNLGTILRSAEAFSAGGVLLGEGTVSPFNHKAVRASAGSIFRLPVVRVKLMPVIAEMKVRGIKTVATSSHKGTPLEEADLTGGLGIFIGSEGKGLPPELLSRMDQSARILHAEAVESLNAAMAAGIVLYEAARQRATTKKRSRQE